MVDLKVKNRIIKLLVLGGGGVNRLREHFVRRLRTDVTARKGVWVEGKFLNCLMFELDAVWKQREFVDVLGHPEALKIFYSGAGSIIQISHLFNCV